MDNIDDLDDFSDSEDVFDFTNESKAIIEIDGYMQQPSNKSAKLEVYQVPIDSRGRCLIINNKEFFWPDGTSDIREGSEIDLKNLSKVFEKMRFDVTVKENLKSHEFDTVLDEEIQHPDHVKSGVFVLVIMSHGNRNNIYGVDGKEVDRLCVINKKLNNSSFPAMKGKPKIVVIQACANENHQQEHESLSIDESSTTLAGNDGENNLAAELFNTVATDGILAIDPKPSTSCSNEKQEFDDFFILNASYEGYEALRLANHGSPFIRAFVEALHKHSHEWDLEKIAKQVQKKIRIFGERILPLLHQTYATNGIWAHVPIMNNSLSKVLYMRPRCELKLKENTKIVYKYLLEDDNDYEPDYLDETPYGDDYEPENLDETADYYEDEQYDYPDPRFDYDGYDSNDDL